MSFLDGLLGSPNYTQAMTSSVSASAGAAIFLTAPPITRQRSGQFRLNAAVSGTLSGSTTGGISAQFFSSLSGAVGPSIVGVGTGGSASAATIWIDQPTLLVGEAISYSVEIQPTNPSTSLTLTNNGSAIVCIEEGGAPSGSGAVTIATSGTGGGGGGGGGGGSLTTAPFTMPAVGSTVVVSVQSGTAFAQGYSVGVLVAGLPSYMTVTLVSGNNVTMLNNGGPTNVLQNTNVISGSSVTVASTNAPIGAAAPGIATSLLTDTTGTYQPIGVRQIFNVRTYGSKCDAKIVGDKGIVGDGFTTFNNSNDVGIANSLRVSFVPGDAGKAITIANVGPNGQDYHGTISLYVGPTEVHVTPNVTLAGSNNFGCWGTDDSAAVQAAANAAAVNHAIVPYYRTSGNRLFFPGSTYLKSSTTIDSNVSLDVIDGCQVHSEVPLLVRGPILAHPTQYIFTPPTVVFFLNLAAQYYTPALTEVHAAWWGAVGDYIGAGAASTDNLRPLRTALASATSLTNTRAGTLRLPRGIMRCSDVPLTIDNGVTDASGGFSSAAVAFSVGMTCVVATSGVAGTMVIPSGGGPLYFQPCKVTGVTGAEPAAWPTNIGGSVVSGGVTFVAVGFRSPFPAAGIKILGHAASPNSPDSIILADWQEPRGTTASLSGSGVLSDSAMAADASWLGCFVLVDNSITGPVQSGTMGVTNGLKTVTTSVDLTGLFFPECQFVFASQAGVVYAIDINVPITSSGFSLTTAYTGTTNAATTGKLLNNNGAWQISSVISATSVQLNDPGGQFTSWTADASGAVTWTVCRRSAVRAWGQGHLIEGVYVQPNNVAGRVLYAGFELAWPPAMSTPQSQCKIRGCGVSDNTAGHLIHGLVQGDTPSMPGLFGYAYATPNGDFNVYEDINVVSALYAGFYTPNTSGQAFNTTFRSFVSNGTTVLQYFPRAGMYAITGTYQGYQVNLGYCCSAFVGFGAIFDMYGYVSEGARRQVLASGTSSNPTRFAITGARIDASQTPADGKAFVFGRAGTYLLKGVLYDPVSHPNFTIEMGNGIGGNANVPTIVSIEGCCFPSAAPFAPDPTLRFMSLGNNGVNVSQALVRLPDQFFANGSKWVWPAGPADTSTIVTQRMTELEDAAVVTTANAAATALYTTASLPSASSGSLEVEVESRCTIAGGAVNVGDNATQTIKYAWKNVAGTVSVSAGKIISAVDGDASMSGVAVTCVVSGTTLVVKVAGILLATIDHQAFPILRTN